MKYLLPFIASGIATGAVYGLAATGLVLTYKTSGIFNFAHGAIATVAAYCFYWLNVEHGVDWKPSLVVSVFVLGPVVGIAMAYVARPLARQRVALKIVGTVGIILVVQGLATIKYGPDPLQLPQFLPGAGRGVQIAGANVGYDEIIISAIAVVVVGILYALFRWTRMGIAMRAVVDNPDLVAARGTSPDAVRLAAWVIGSTFAALSGVLVAPLIGVDALLLTLLVVQAFGAAAIGYFTSIPLTLVGGVIIGVGAAVSQKYVVYRPWLAGLPTSLPFIVLLVVLLALPRRRLVPASSPEIRPPLEWRAPAIVRLVAAALILAPLILVPHVVGVKLTFYTVALTQVVLLLSLGLLVRTSGQVSLCQSAFAAMGAVVFSQVQLQLGMPWLVALVIAGLVTAAIGVLVAVPAIRLAGLFLALATFGFGIMMERFVYPLSIGFTRSIGSRVMARPSFVSGDTQYYYFVLGWVVLTALVMVGLHEARLGRILRGLSDSPVGVATLGLSTNVTRAIVFAVSAFFAAVSGVLYGATVHFAASSDVHYESFNSLVLLGMLAIAPFSEPWYALVAGIAAVIPAYLTGAHTSDWLNVLFGVFAVFIALRGGPHRMPSALREFLSRFARGRREASPQRSTALPPSRLAPEAQRTGLDVQHIGVSYGGAIAIKDFSFNAPMGRITGLIGPNGAGKTSTFDVCCGWNRRSDGKILLHGEDVTRLGPAARGRRGLGRTFQRMQLCDSLSVAENVMMGRECSLAGANVFTQLFARPAERRLVDQAGWAAMELCGIASLGSSQAGALSTAERRLVELARCLAGPFDVLLLDEPSSGLDPEETRRFGDVLTRVVNDRRCAIVLVEHDVALVMKVCSYIYVLDFGVLVAEGDPASIQESSVVQAAYLGSDAVPELAALEEQSG